VISSLPPDVLRTALTVGTFDGMHRGHQFLLAELVRAARARDLKSLLVTFDPHPLEIVNPTAAPLLLTVGDEKLEVIGETGIDYVAIVPFTRSLANLEAERFVRDVLCGRFRMHYLLMGHDHGFGRNRSGNSVARSASRWTCDHRSASTTARRSHPPPSDARSPAGISHARASHWAGTIP
jgi:riboflavin kinase / FMN adenylyltransferase